MDEYGTWAERKKKNWDCLAHPVLLYRRDDEKQTHKDTNKNYLQHMLPDTLKKVVPGTSKAMLKRAQSANKTGKENYVKEGGGSEAGFKDKIDALTQTHDNQPLKPVYDHSKRPLTAQEKKKEFD